MSYLSHYLTNPRLWFDFITTHYTSFIIHILLRVLMDSLEAFIRNLQGFQSSNILRDWAIQHGLRDNVHVLARLRELDLSEMQQREQDREGQQNDNLWKLVVDSFTSEAELIQFAGGANYLNDIHVRRRLEELRQVCDI